MSTTTPPHFPAIYGDFEAQIAINSGDAIQGRLPATALRLVREWAKLKRAALEENWRRRSMGIPLERIDGLDAE